MNRKTTTDQWIDLIVTDEVDLTRMPDAILRDLIDVLRARQQPVLFDAVSALWIAAVCHQLRADQHEAARATATALGADLADWTDEQMSAAIANKRKITMS